MLHLKTCPGLAKRLPMTTGGSVLAMPMVSLLPSRSRFMSGSKKLMARLTGACCTRFVARTMQRPLTTLNPICCHGGVGKTDEVA